MRELRSQPFRFIIATLCVFALLIGCSVEELYHLCSALRTAIVSIGFGLLFYRMEQSFKRELHGVSKRALNGASDIQVSENFYTKCPTACTVIHMSFRALCHSVVPQDSESFHKKLG